MGVVASGPIEFGALQPFSLLSRLGARVDNWEAAPEDVARPWLFNRGKGARRLIGSESGSGFQDVLKLGQEFWLVVSNFPVSGNLGARVLGDDVVKFHFKASGATRVSVPGQLDVRLGGQSGFVMLHPHGVEKLETVLEGSHELSATVIAKRKTLAEFYEQDSDDPPAFMRSILAHGGESIAYHDVAPTVAMATVVRDLVHSPFRGQLRSIHAEAKARELMCMMLHRIGPAASGGDAAVVLSPADTERLHAARDILSTSYMDSVTNSVLARKVGLNQKKLRIGFKQLFQETTFDYSQRLRMERAQELLHEGSMPLSHIAEAVGYNFASSFSVAFKRHFGMLPRHVRRR
ncbi:MAG: AraC family transcriptional regulator [Haliea sp.]